MRARLNVIGLILVGAAAVAPAHAEWKGQGQAGIVFARGNTDTDTANVKVEMAKEINSWTHKFGIAALRAAVHDDEAQPAEDEDAPGRNAVSLRQRLWPVIELFERSLSEKQPVVWGV